MNGLIFCRRIIITMDEEQAYSNRYQLAEFFKTYKVLYFNTGMKNIIHVVVLDSEDNSAGFQTTLH